MNKFYLFLAVLVLECEDTIDYEDCAGNVEDYAGACGGDAYYDYCSICDNDLYNDCQIELSSDDLILLNALNNFETKIDNPNHILFSTFSDSSNIGELGNVVINRPEQSLPKYKLFFSEYFGTFIQTNVFINYIYSSDGKDWEIHEGDIINRPLEDPYVIIYDNIYYLFAEEKFDIPFSNIRRYHSTDGVEWIDDGDVLDITVGNHYENRDVSSPLVMIEDEVWFMYYEGRGQKWYGSKFSTII